MVSSAYGINLALPELTQWLLSKEFSTTQKRSFHIFHVHCKDFRNEILEKETEKDEDTQ